MSERLTGTVALVTGASSGIGAAAAQSLAAEGATVAIVARRRDRLAEVAQSIRDRGGRVLVIEADISDQSQSAAAIDQVIAEFGRLDTVVNNAGVMLVGPVLEAPASEWQQMLAVNVQGMLHVTQAALPHLIRAAQDSSRGVADLVNISSTAGRVARPGTAVYNLTKFGMNAFSEALRQEVMGYRVRVGVIEPGTVDTELASHVRDGIRESVEQQQAGIEMLLPQDIADAMIYVVTRHRRVAVNELLVRAGAQTW